jgi:hypothetical protein
VGSPIWKDCERSFLEAVESIAAAILGALHVETKHMEISAPWFKTKGC